MLKSGVEINYHLFHAKLSCCKAPTFPFRTDQPVPFSIGKAHRNSKAPKQSSVELIVLYLKWHSLLIFYPQAILIIIPIALTSFALLSSFSPRSIFFPCKDTHRHWPCHRDSFLPPNSVIRKLPSLCFCSCCLADLNALGFPQVLCIPLFPFDLKLGNFVPSDNYTSASKFSLEQQVGPWKWMPYV